ncbi:carboxylesterase/lipase family protein [Cryptosporangium phraense]|uniref:Carboxylic ester hydrolase n=1 Tax=Cryptosporangium phraense TaxID=2593070 RepID=A0A545ATN2_9ACTN|nr:carboxylesterase/lipase family protein [Cryptosporangium phraense]TQS43955.1 carboxylesterase/lipase family protein [Cryptosporangium phraense]
MVEVRVTGGVIRGATDDGVSRFLGVPYAAPPFGANRMRPPAAVVGWDGVRDATAYGPTVPKGDYPEQYAPLFPEVVIPGDECLNLNVWTPTGAQGLPVLVWIHGGAFVNGSGSVSAYDGTAFARDGVVTVTINYRLGPDGSLYFENDENNANLGLQDQVAALRWVRDNIAAFGGDPDRVTVAGESAGAMSVSTLLALPSAAGLFAQAITESGATAHTLPPKVGLTVSRSLAERLGVDATREAIAAVELDVLVKAAEEFHNDAQAVPDPEKYGALAARVLVFAPVVDGVVLPQHPLDAVRAGASRNVRILLGSNRQEARLFLVAGGTLDLIGEAELVAGAAAYGLGPEGLEPYRRAEPDASPGDLLAQVVSDWYFGVPAIRLAEAHQGTTFAYVFDRPFPEENHGYGSAHAVEIPFVFDTIDDPSIVPILGGAPSRAVADSTHAVWVRFITDGDPGWAPYTVDRRTTGILTETVTPVDDPRSAERAVWDGLL